MATSAVFALCVRSAARHLPKVLSNLEALSGLYDRSAFVFVEGDSGDDTKALLKAWITGRPETSLIELDGLESRLPLRTERLAFCRNAYMDFIRTSPLAACDQLVILDSDEINGRPIDLKEFARSRDWLAPNGAAAVFANSRPFYYDIWALRHPTWCPEDFKVEIQRERQAIGKIAATERYCLNRQIPIPTTAQPIEVQSAFGGLAIYRMTDALGARYVGLTQDGREVCEHVAFNMDVGRSGRRLFILPWMTAGSPVFTGVTLPKDSRQLTLTQAGRSCVLTGPPDHAIDRYRETNPLYDRRLPVLARLIDAAAPGSVAIDVGANIGDTIALCRLEGANLRFIAVEAALSYLKYLFANQRDQPELFSGVEAAWNFVGRAGETTQVELLRGTAHRVEGPADGDSHTTAPPATLERIARERQIQPGALSLVKLDTDGYDHVILLNELAFLKAEAPILWAEAETFRAEDDASWDRFLADGAATWPYLVAFDNLGFACMAGPTAKKRRGLVDRISYTRRRKATPKQQFGRATIHYLDVALFPKRFAAVFDAFLAELPELAGG